MSHTSQDDSIAKVKDTKNTNDDEKYKEDTSKIQEGNESVDNTETSDTLSDDSIRIINNFITVLMLQSILSVFFIIVIIFCVFLFCNTIISTSM